MDSSFHANKVTRRLPRGEAAWRHKLASYKCSAAARGFEWQLSEERFRELLSSQCYYCGAPPATLVKPGGKTPEVSGAIVVNGIDRLDNAAGYTAENSVACCPVCNRAKRDMPLADFYAWLDRLVKHHKVECQTLT